MSESCEVGVPDVLWIRVRDDHIPTFRTTSRRQRNTRLACPVPALRKSAEPSSLRVIIKPWAAECSQSGPCTIYVQGRSSGTDLEDFQRDDAFLPKKVPFFQ